MNSKYLDALKSPDNAGLVDAATVDEIFYQIPEILNHHEVFLDELQNRLSAWEARQTIGDVFLDVFTKPVVLEAYSLFLDNWKCARMAIKTTCQAKPAFARFLEMMEREHKGKLGLDQLLIKPVQKIPRYELLIQRLLKHTDPKHPDYKFLQVAQKEIHELVVKINCTERESLEWEHQQNILRELQGLIEGLTGIVANDRTFVRHDLVTIASNHGMRKERALFLFNDLLVITNIKRRSGTIRKPSTSSAPNSLIGLLEANKYKMLMRIPLDDLEVKDEYIVSWSLSIDLSFSAKDEDVKRMEREVVHLQEDCATLSQIQELAVKIHGNKTQLEDVIKDMLYQTQRQLTERNAAQSELTSLELALNTQSDIENISMVFTKSDNRASWEESFNEAKQKLTLSADRRLCPEFAGSLPVRKTRAGLQFTCATPTLPVGEEFQDVWVCNSDGYVGHMVVYIYFDNKVFVSLADGDIAIYTRDHTGGWNTSDPTVVSVSTASSPITKMLPVSGKLWCGCHNCVKVFNTHSLNIEHNFVVSNDASRAVTCMVNSGSFGVWISLHNSAVLRLFHADNYECLTDINVAPAVTKMLASCDDIIRQHKAACLRVTSLLACNELLWIGTSAGVLLTVPIPHIKPSTQRISQPPIITGIPHGHTGHVRFLTCVETGIPSKPEPRTKVNRHSSKSKKVHQNNINRGKLLVISGGDGYEDFRGPQASAELH
ncbi:rho guanine nucleotide exchange factor 17-like isoform X9 [Vespula maculifrons]|uniref:Rho guanine nucleotide exchange factor 17-like isoform X9 n=1 Tax=Vespula maculifrons TaxID=7453 RepID=A0ABD2B4F6_VESMC